MAALSCRLPMRRILYRSNWLGSFEQRYGAVVAGGGWGEAASSVRPCRRMGGPWGRGMSGPVPSRLQAHGRRELNPCWPLGGPTRRIPAEPGRTLVRGVDREVDLARERSFDGCAGVGHPGLVGALGRKPTPFRVGQEDGAGPGVDRQDTSRPWRVVAYERASQRTRNCPRR